MLKGVKKVYLKARYSNPIAKESKYKKEYEKLEEQMKDIAPITKTIEEAKTIEVLHNLIKNNGQDFNLSNEQLELVEKLK